MPVGLAERRFWFKVFGIDIAFDHHLGFRRHHKVH